MVAHYYTDPEIQQLAEETGGCIARLPGDGALWCQTFGLHAAGRRGALHGRNRQNSQPGKDHFDADPERRVLIDLGCPIDEFTAFCDAHPDRTVVVYANTSAAVKARADWVVTSSIAVELIEHLDSLGQKSSGRPIATLDAMYRNRPVQMCCAGRAPASCTTSLRPRR